MTRVSARTQPHGISGLETQPERRFLNASGRPCGECRHQPRADARSRARKRRKREARISLRCPQQTRGRPSLLPFCFAFRRPARTRSWIRARDGTDRQTCGDLWTRLDGSAGRGEPDSKSLSLHCTFHACRLPAWRPTAGHAAKSPVWYYIAHRASWRWRRYRGLQSGGLYSQMQPPIPIPGTNTPKAPFATSASSLRKLSRALHKALSSTTPSCVTSFSIPSCRS